MAGAQRLERKQAVSDHKRSLILDAARRVFEQEGLDGASLRAIAAEAGYTPAALYFHFDSKEAIYAEVLRVSVARLREEIERAVAKTRSRREIARGGDGVLRFLRFEPARSRSRLLSLPWRHEAAWSRQGARQTVECGACLRAAIDFRRRRGAGREKGRGAHAYGRYLRACSGASLACAYAPHPHVRRFRARFDGALYR